MEPLRMFVNGQAMAGGSLNSALINAEFLGPATTAPRYRFYSVRDEFPALLPVEQDGGSILGELYEVDYRILREELLPNEPPELELCVIDLATGGGSLCMRMRDTEPQSQGVIDITDWGGWRAYLEAKANGHD